MYFAVGGRKTQSGVYRVTYVGDESTAPAKALPLDEEFKMRAALEALTPAKSIRKRPSPPPGATSATATAMCATPPASPLRSSPSTLEGKSPQ
jgi:hypothetical protein